MSSLLKRQIRKFLPEALVNTEEMKVFLDAVHRTYVNYEEQFSMLQRAMELSSDELFEVNERLRKEADEQKEVIDKLRDIMKTFTFYELPEAVEMNSEDVSGTELVAFVGNQAKEIVEMNKQRDDLNKELAQQNQELNDYAHMVSHDLKSPLRNIDFLSLSLVEDYGEQLDEGSKQQLDLIRGNVEKMDGVISGILEYSSIDKNATKRYEVDIAALLQNIVETIKIPSNIQLKIAKNLPKVKGNKYRLQQIFQNLIDNAVKYNDKDQGLIEVGMVENPKAWEFYVRDNGKGISKDHFDKIFVAFTKLENRQDSTGIGLSIVKKIIEVYGGKIWVESKVGKGTVFYFTLGK